MGKADRKIGWGIAWLSFGVGAVIAVVAAPELPKWGIVPLIGFAGFSFAITLYLLGWFKAPHALGTPLRIVLLLLLISAPLLWLGWKVYPRIDVRVSFEGSDLAGWKITNKSNIDLHDILYHFGLLDLDQPFLYRDPNFPDNPYSPLPIRVAKIDFINEGDSRSGIVLPQDVLNTVRAGDHLFGIASFSCPKCEEKLYWLMIVHRHGGWFAPVNGGRKGLSIPAGKNAREEIERLVPPAARIPIH